MVATDKRRIQMDLPDYRGPDRRLDGNVIVTQCGCHPKHERVLSDHDKQIDGIIDDIKARRVELDERMEKRYSRVVAAKESLEKNKVSNKLFYLFISVYSILFIFGIVAVYTGMNKIDKNLSEKIYLLSTEVKVVDVKVSSHVTASTEIKENMKDIDDKLDAHIHQTSNGNAHGVKR